MNHITNGQINEFMIKAAALGGLSVSGTQQGSVSHSVEGTLCKTSVILSADVSVLIGATGARATGFKLFDFPLCRVAVLASRIELAGLSWSEVGASSTAGEVGLGSVVGSGAVAVLSGTATFKDYCSGGNPAIGNIAAAATLARFVTGDGPRGFVGSLAVAPSLFFNLATTMAGATGACNAVIKAGSRFDLVWSPIAP